MPNRRIALCLWSFDNEYQDLQRRDALEHARYHRIKVTEYSAQNDPETQVAQIRQALAANERPYAVLVHPVGDSRLIAVAREAASQGVGWVILNRDAEYMHDLRQKFPLLPVFCVKPDQHQVGRIQGRQFRRLLPEGGELFYIQGPLLVSTAEARFAGVQEELRGAPIKLVTFRADWTSEGGEQALLSWIQTVESRDLPRCLVGAQNDNMAVGAKQALVSEADARGQPQIADVRVTGCDGLPSFGQRLVREGTLAATVLIPPTAGRAVDQVGAALGGAAQPPEEIVLGVSSFPPLEDLQAANLPSNGS
jgi:ABC-type sugar transport system substrate-binding protein